MEEPQACVPLKAYHPTARLTLTELRAAGFISAQGGKIEGQEALAQWGGHQMRAALRSLIARGLVVVERPRHGSRPGVYVLNWAALEPDFAP